MTNDSASLQSKTFVEMACFFISPANTASSSRFHRQTHGKARSHGRRLVTKSRLFELNLESEYSSGRNTGKPDRTRYSSCRGLSEDRELVSDGYLQLRASFKTSFSNFNDQAHVAPIGILARRSNCRCMRIARWLIGQLLRRMIRKKSRKSVDGDLFKESRAQFQKSCSNKATMVGRWQPRTLCSIFI